MLISDKYKWLIVISTTIFVGLLPVCAVADIYDAVERFIPTSDDGGFSFLRQLFGDVVCNVARDETCQTEDLTPTLLVGTIVTTSSLILGVVASLFSWVGIKGLIHSAESGKFLGEKSDKYFVIARMVGAPLLIVPLPVAGYLSTVQLGAIFVAILSSGLGNLTLGGLVDSIGKDNMISAPKGYIDDDINYQMAADLLTNEVCMYSLYRQSREADQAINLNYKYVDFESRSNKFRGDNPAQAPVSNRTEDRQRTMLVRSVSWSVDGYDDEICGNMKFPIKLVTQFGSSSAIDLANALLKLNMDEFNTLSEKIRPIAKEIALAPRNQAVDLDKLARSFKDAVLDFNSQIKKKSLINYANFNTAIVNGFKENILKGGFVFAGAWFWRIAERQSQLDSMTNSNLKSFQTATPEEDLPEKYAAFVTDRLVIAQQVRKKVALNSGIMSEVSAMSESGETSIAGNMSLYVGEYLTSFLQPSGNEHPLIHIKHMGNNIAVLGTVLLGLGGGSKFLSSKFPVVKDFSETIGTLMIFIGLALWALGFMLGTWVPLLPYVTFLLGVIGWLILVIYTVVFAPLWMLLHMLPDGEGLSGQATQGYYIMLTSLLRPTLLVVGFAAGASLFHVAIGLFDMTFFGFYGMSGFTGLFDALSRVVVYAIVVLTLARVCFSLIYKLPAFLPQLWGGNNPEPVAPGSSEVGKEIEQHGVLIANQVTHAKPSGPGKPKKEGPTGVVEDTVLMREQMALMESASRVHIGENDLTPESHSHTDGNSGANLQAGKENDGGGESKQASLDLDERPSRT